MADRPGPAAWRRLAPPLIAVLAGLAGCRTTQPGIGSIEARLAAQNAIFEAEYQFDLKMHPLHATEVGDHRYDSRLPDLSLAAARTIHSAEVDFLARLRAIPTDGFPEEDALSHRIMLRKLEQDLADYDLRLYEMPVSQVQGPQIEFADLPLSMPFDSVQAYENYLARLRQIPHALSQTRTVLQTGASDQLMPARYLLEKVPAQCRGLVRVDPFIGPLQHFPDSVPPEERQRLTQAITATVERDVLPAFRAFGEFIATDYAPHGRTALSIESLPGGRARYLNEIRRATSRGDLSPAQIHDLGLREVARIQEERLRLAQSQGYTDVDSYRRALDGDARYRPTSAAQIVDAVRGYIDQMRPQLPRLFGSIPTDPLSVEPMPPFEPDRATHYQVGSPDGTRPGRIVVATSDFAHRSLLTIEALAYHQGIPGHHLQMSLQQSLTQLPKFRQHEWTPDYVEGWALYAEQLGREAGFYRDPGSDFGRLSLDLFRAVRLVVDTGLHDQGWSREQAIRYLRQAEAVDEPTTQSEIDREIALPGQALSFKIGELAFLDLRARAQRALGPRFDLRAFDDRMLNGGAMPPDLLRERTDRWIESLTGRQPPPVLRR